MRVRQLARRFGSFADLQASAGVTQSVPHVICCGHKACVRHNVSQSHACPLTTSGLQTHFRLKQSVAPSTLLLMSTHV